MVKAKGDTRAAIVSREAEALVAEGPHRLKLIGGHGAKAVRFVALTTRWLARLSLAAQIWDDDGERFGQCAGYLVPPLRRRWIVAPEVELVSWLKPFEHAARRTALWRPGAGSTHAACHLHRVRAQNDFSVTLRSGARLGQQI
jgi:hypothetical protein